MYDEIALTPIVSEEPYSRLRATQTKVRQSDDPMRRAYIDQNTTKGVKETSTKVTTAVIITVIMILLILMLISIVLSVATFSQLTSELSKVATKLDNQNEDIRIQLTLIQNNISQLDDRLNDFISTEFNPSQCGAGLWWRVAYLDMTEPSQQCPSAWREYNTDRGRACGRPESSTGSCAAVLYFTNRQYSRVCGRIIGYQVASPDAFRIIEHKFDGRGLDGVIISHGEQQDHIWSFAAGITEEGSTHRQSNCPCSPEAGTQSPENIRGTCNYFCESGNSDNDFERGRLYSSDRLWDGQQCEGIPAVRVPSLPHGSVYSFLLLLQI